MTTVALVHRGFIECAAMLLDDRPDKRAWVLSVFEPGVTVHATSRGLLMRWPKPRRLEVETAQGLCLTEVAGLLSSAPVTVEALLLLGASPRHVIVARAGQLEAVAIGAPIDLSTWIEVSRFTHVEVRALAEPLAVVPIAPAAEPVNLRAFLKGGPTETPTLALTQRPRPSLMSEWLGRLRQFFSTLTKQTSDASPPAPSRPSAWQRFVDRLNRALLNSPLGGLLRERQSKYVDELNDLFDRGDLDEALRRAIPLNNTPASPDAAPSVALPDRRSSLAISMRQPSTEAPSRVMEMGPFEQLQARYRAAAAKLIAENRIEEAAFVYADLLQAPAEAVALLEQHGRHRLAAELAEARQLSADLQIRLWLQAGALERAVAIARRGHFSAAVIRLDKEAPKLAQTLRLAWADSLASGGDFVSAVGVLRMVSSATSLKLRFIDHALELGGARSMALLFERVELDPSCVPDITTRVHAIINAEGAEAAMLRLALAAAMVTGVEDTIPLRRGLARALTRALTRDQGRYGIAADGHLRQLLALDAGALRTDFPPLASLPPRQRPTELRFTKDASAPPARDATLLPDRRLLVALGDNGAALSSAAGRPLLRLEGSFSRLIEGEGLVLGLEPREALQRTSITRLELTQRRATPWADLAITREASSHHEGLWFVVEQQTVLGLDLAAPTPLAIWRGGVLPGAASAMAASARHLSVLVELPTLALELWTYDLPTFTLRTRWAMPFEPLAARAVTAEGWVCFAGALDDGSVICAVRHQNAAPREFALAGPPVSPPALDRLHVAIAVRTQRSITVEVFGLRQGSPQTARLVFEEATRATVRQSQGYFVVTADNGRVVAFDPNSLRVVAEFPSRGAR